METSLWFLLVLFIVYLWYTRDHASGRVTIAPGKGTIRIPLPFYPKHVELEFIGCNPVPGCSQLEDVVSVISTDVRGFIMRYDIQSGVRVVRWRACA